MPLRRNVRVCSVAETVPGQATAVLELLPQTVIDEHQPEVARKVPAAQGVNVVVEREVSDNPETQFFGRSYRCTDQRGQTAVYAETAGVAVC